ncbi:MAG: AAA family ATPase [Sutterellaceae bacterium]|nr:AAA family ATPase [Sutterellaceae bacterium]
MKLYDKNKELALFEREIRGVEQEQKSRFTVVSGRRRVGKTKLVLEAFAKDTAPSVYLFCSPYAVERELARQWMNEVCQKLELPERYKAETVGDVIEVIFEEAKRRRINLFIDEVQDMLTVAPSFFDKLRGQWDKLTLTGPSHLLMTLSGSVASVVKQLFSDYSQPLYGRITARIELKPFFSCRAQRNFCRLCEQTQYRGAFEVIRPHRRRGEVC